MTMIMEPTATTPRPPIWIRIRMTSCPKKLQGAYVSTTTSPVTQTDVVAVKSAVRKSVMFPDALDMGSIKRIVPMIIAMRKLTGM